jgi:hypothetical protein
LLSAGVNTGRAAKAWEGPKIIPRVLRGSSTLHRKNKKKGKVAMTIGWLSSAYLADFTGNFGNTTALLDPGQKCA